MCKNTHIQKCSVKPEHNFGEIIFGVEQLCPSALCERQEGANDLLPLISNLPTSEPGEHAALLFVCVSNGSLVNARAGPWSQINESWVITQGADSNYLIPINIIKRSLLSDGAKWNTIANQACTHIKIRILNIAKIHSSMFRFDKATFQSKLEAAKCWLHYKLIITFRFENFSSSHW